ncbi:hypothetical protein [Micromonospora sp. M71_S20]|uniref:hypothetical protein n=1 Tax=Micromonospora sp. M71_S20 TaxID=592872 RepID=UPI0018F6E841|nr:hypothetical protein [Micromonospora sp. M71_S20]
MFWMVPAPQAGADRHAEVDAAERTPVQVVLPGAGDGVAGEGVVDGGRGVRAAGNGQPGQGARAEGGAEQHHAAVDTGGRRAVAAASGLVETVHRVLLLIGTPVGQ